jgi:hypothetical protein
MSRSLADLKEPFRSKAIAFLDALNADPRLKDLGVVRFLIVETLRDIDVQLLRFSAYGEVRRNRVPNYGG